MYQPAITTTGHILNAVGDAQDTRDLPYQPALILVPDHLDPPDALVILDQENEGACTGFALAAVLNHLDIHRTTSQGTDPRSPVSPRMLYEMARKFDEWPGEDYAGSSCRGAMRGWQNMGVCRATDWPYSPHSSGRLTLRRARSARATKPGAYYRLKPRVSDYHTALVETGAIFVSASVHSGWDFVDPDDPTIEYRDDNTGGHAFAIVGYNDRGFWVQNSWGEGWGRGGLALWTYEDWQKNVMDAWVVRFAASTPEFHGGSVSAAGREAGRPQVRSTRRDEIAGHFVHIDDGEFHETGRYFTSIHDINETADYLEDAERFRHLLFYAHGGLNSPRASANRIAAMKPVFKANGIYPFHFMYDTGLMEELLDVVLRRDGDRSRAAGIGDIWDAGIERLTRVPGRALWREMKQGARSPFHTKGAGTRTVAALLGALRSNVKVHLVGHSTGAILLGHLLQRLGRMAGVPRISTCSLLAPACTLEDYREFYAPLLKTPRREFGINDLQVYNLTDRLERDDNVAQVYRKSLLYLVSRGFEEKKGEPLLGMERHVGDLGRHVEFIFSEGPNGGETASTSTSHGGFDNDPATMNSILKKILGTDELPGMRFTRHNLDY